MQSDSVDYSACAKSIIQSFRWSIKSEKFNVKEQLDRLKQLSGTMLACGTCIESRKMQFKVRPISTMKEMLKLEVESDKVLTF